MRIGQGIANVLLILTPTRRVTVTRAGEDWGLLLTIRQGAIGA
jgi:hypothetical protein